MEDASGWTGSVSRRRRFGRTASHHRPTIEGPEILYADGQLVGRVGEQFTFSGGLVPFLHEGIGFTEADQALAASRCPGTFWIVAPSTVSSP